VDAPKDTHMTYEHAQYVLHINFIIDIYYTITNMSYQFNLDTQYEYEDWVADQCGHEKIEGWRKEMFIAALKNLARRPESYQEEWDDDLLLPQAHRDFAKYSD
jgi:hypothetical protein